MTILDDIVEVVREKVEKKKRSFPLDTESVKSRSGISLKDTIKLPSDEVSLIGELKKKSPSRGEIRKDFRVKELARDIEEGGARGLSILTEEDYFDGRLSYLEKVKDTVDIPVLRKDFIVDEYQVFESVRHKADAILLIADVLDERLPDFVDLTEDLGMEPLVEVRDEDDVESAISAGASLIGINNRDLKTMKVDIENTEKIIDSLPENIVKVSESGIRTRDDVRRVQAAGADGVLVGTSIMGSGDVRSKVRNLIGG